MLDTQLSLHNTYISNNWALGLGTSVENSDIGRQPVFKTGLEIHPTGKRISQSEPPPRQLFLRPLSGVLALRLRPFLSLLAVAC